MKYIYTEKDLDIISWDRIDKFIDKIYGSVKNYLEKNNLKIKYICPILRGGGIPAIKLSHMFNVENMLPIQLKHKDKKQDIEIKLGLDYVKDTKINENECILLVEGNHVTGSSSNIAVNILREKFGDNIKISYYSD